FFDTELGGSAHGIEKGGLTAAGADMVRRMEEKSMIIDLAHASTRTIDDILAIATRPVVVSHTGVKGTCDNIRNLSDDQLRRIAAMGGLIGI
ncbi:membrane dipeptidase, partial [Xenorhabdus bovienii]